MSMRYIIGYNPDRKEGEQWEEVDVNSTTDMFLSEILSTCIEHKYPDIYEKITEQSGAHFMKFDELSQEEFMKVVTEVSNLSKNENLADSQKNGLQLWQKILGPLILVDQRYKN